MQAGELRFEPGDVVTLRSGGPSMTVTAVFPDRMVRTQWFDEQGTLNDGTFVAVVLEKCTVGDIAFA